jgi:hypothetical protein
VSCEETCIVTIGHVLGNYIGKTLFFNSLNLGDFLDYRKTMLKPSNLIKSLKMSLWELKWHYEKNFYFKSIMAMMPIRRCTQIIASIQNRCHFWSTILEPKKTTF